MEKDLVHPHFTQVCVSPFLAYREESVTSFMDEIVCSLISLGLWTAIDYLSLAGFDLFFNQTIYSFMDALSPIFSGFDPFPSSLSEAGTMTVVLQFTNIINSSSGRGR